MPLIRPERPTDIAPVFAVNQAAFDTDLEARLVDRLREDCTPFLSLVAEADDRIVGHILFTAVSLNKHPDLMLLGLAPMAVLPKYQRQGVGTALVQAGLDACRELDAGAVVVLGHPGYYPRFGFSPASQFGLDCEFEVPDEAFMALELDPGYLDGFEGTIHYHPLFSQL